MTQARTLGGNTYSLAAMVLLLIFAVTACAPQAADQSAELAALADSWENALNAGDVDGLAAVYADDCVIMPPNTEMQVGQAAARAAFGEMIDAGLTGELDTVKAVAAGGVGYHAGSYWLRAPDGTVVDRGKFIEGWQKVGDEWKIVHDIWNSDWAPYATATTIAITHDVKDGDHWLAAWQGEGSRHDDFARNGVANVRVFQNPEAPKKIGLLVDVADMAAFEAFLNSDEGAAAKAEDGVIDKGMGFYMEVK